MERCRLVTASDVGDLTDLEPGTVVIVCDPDGVRAAGAASSIQNHRTAVFVGDATDLAAKAFTAEIFAPR